MVWLWCITACFCLGGAATAVAQDSKRTAADVASIKQFMQDGQASFVAGQYEDAAAIFDKGYAKHPYSAFLFNAGVAFEKSNKLTEAIERFRKYLEVDAKAPDASEVAKRVAKVEKSLAEQKAHGTKSKSGVKSPDAAKPPDIDTATKSLVIIDTEPPGANLHVFRRIRGESTYVSGGKNPDWQEVLVTKSTANASLDVGHYHVEVDGIEDYKNGSTSFEVLSGHVLQVKVSLSADFMAHLRVTSNVIGARIFLDDPGQSKPAWGNAPHSELVEPGEHTLLAIATGYAPVKRTLSLRRGQHQELQIQLERLGLGGLRLTSNVSRASVFLDGVEVGTYAKSERTFELKDIKAGTHRLRVLAEGRKPLDTVIQIPRGQILPVYAQLVVFPPRGAAYTQAVIAGVLLGGGIYLGLESNRLYDEMSKDRRDGTLASDDPRDIRGKVYSITADVGFLGAAVLSGFSVYNFVRDPLPPSRAVPRKAVEFDAPPRAPGTDSKPARVTTLPTALEPPELRSARTAHSDASSSEHAQQVEEP